MMAKLHKFDATECSPNSPFQFGLMRGLSHNFSCSASSGSLDTDREEEQVVTFNGTNKSRRAIAGPSPFQTFGVEELKSKCSHLSPAMKRGHELQVALHQSHARLQGIISRTSLLDLAISPLAFQSSKAKRIEDHMHKATQPAKTALRVFESMQKLSETLSAGPSQDVGFYVEALGQYQQHMKVMQQCGPMVIQALKDGVFFLKGSRIVDRFHMEKLFEVIKTLQSLLEGQEQLAIPVTVVRQALEHLVAAFERIISDYVKPVHLSAHQCTATKSPNEKRKIAEPKRFLPAPVLQTLQGIAVRLAFNNNIEVCLEVYAADRGYKLKQSLQTLQPDSYLCYQTTDAINHIEWAALEEHLAMWSQHLEDFVSVLLSSEYTFCKRIFYETGPDATRRWKDGFGRMAMQVGLASFIEFGEAFSKSHMEPQKLFKLLDMLECLEKLKPEFEEMFDGGGVICRGIQKRIWSLKSGVVEGVAQVLKEMKYRIEMQEESSKENLENSIGMSKGGAVLKLVSYTVNYLKYMLSEWYGPLLGRALEVEHGLNEARYDETIDASKSGTDDAEKKLDLYVAVLEIMQALEKTIATTAERLRGMPAYASFFLMNNYSYIYTRCVKSHVGDLLGEGWLQTQLDKMELYAMHYKQEAWGQLVALVTCEGLSSSFNRIISSGSSAGRELIRQRARAFQAALHNLVARHSAWSIPNEDLRKRICHDVLQSVVPAYRSFLERYSHFLSSKLHLHVAPSAAGANHIHDQPDSPSLITQLDNTIIKYTPETVEHMLTSIFETRVQPRHHTTDDHSVIAGQKSSTSTHSMAGGGEISDHESAASQTSYSDIERPNIDSCTSTKKGRFARFRNL